MSKVKSDKTPHYELLYLISNKYSEGELTPLQEKVTKLINANEGVITHTENMGKRRLAYAIKGFRYGYYQVIEFDMPGANLLKFENTMKLDSEILRHQVIRKVAKSAEILAEEAANRQRRLAEADERAKQKIENANKPEVKNDRPYKSAKPAEKFVEKTVKPKAEPKVTIDSETAAELDSKLDKILDSDILYK